MRTQSAMKAGVKEQKFDVELRKLITDEHPSLKQANYELVYYQGPQANWSVQPGPGMPTALKALLIAHCIGLGQAYDLKG
jgi:hypothetical protein